MRIFGGHDYYDTALAYGRDNEIVLQRNTNPTPIPYKQVPLRRESNVKIKHENDRYFGYPSERDIQSVTVYFAGKRYGGFRFGILSQPMYVWTLETFKDELEKRKLQYKNNDDTYWYRPVKEFDTVEEFLTPDSATPKELDWLIDNRVSIAVYSGKYRNEEWTLNPCNLKDIQFYKALEPYTAFQELSMFIGGVLPRSPNPMIELKSEKVMLAKHGFDEWTFKKMPKEKVK